MTKTILIVDDNVANRYVLESLFGSQGYNVLSASNGKQGMEIATEQPPDLIISDILMPVMDGYEFCRRVRQEPSLKTVPFIFYTATYTDQKDELFALGLGVNKFLLKPLEPEVLIKEVHGILEESQHDKDSPAPRISSQADFDHFHSDALFRKLEDKVSELQKTNHLLREEIRERSLVENRLQILVSAIERSPVAMAITDDTGTIEYANTLFRQTQSEAMLPGGIIKSLEDSNHSERKRLNKNGKEIIESVLIYGVRDSAGQLVNTIILIEDVTQRKAMEERLAQAQKMEELGLVASGVAHDINNILSAITGFCDLALFQLKDEQQIRSCIQEIKQATARGSGLTHHLLSSSRKRSQHTETLDLNVLVQEFYTFLKLIIPPEIRLQVHYSSTPLRLTADKGQIEQILMNLVINARDAMPTGGELNVKLYKNLYSPTPEGIIEVQDTGVGMTPEVKQRILEPFFTTKDEGKGTGLGLSLVNGIVENHHGRLEIESLVGLGSLFRIYLPMD